MDKIEKQGEQIENLIVEFRSFKTITNDKLNEIFESLKPQFTEFQVVSFLLSLCVVMGGIMMYVSDIKSDARNNDTRIEYLEDSRVLQKSQNQTIIKGLSEIKTDIAVVKSEIKVNFKLNK